KQLFDEKRDLFLAFGFETENTEFGVKIIALPNMFRSIANERFFLDMLDTLSSLPEEKSKGEPPTDSIADAIASAACKAAVKAKDHLDESEARALIERMLTLENPFTCPHGRPTIVEMTKYEWEKKFKRV
ncbi:MAG: DNA mismatch repair protein MutL, partial [Clostridiales bacterium]|nr:DNA mismatch repair protein MutL [Clostridiales bacterium]